MKTSFYFVLWIVMYPILDLFNSPFVNQNSFILALLAVWGISYFLNRSIPNILSYERRTGSYPLLEKVYTRDVADFMKNLSTKTTVSIISAIYFIVSEVVIIITFFNNFDNWLSVIIFAFFAFSAMKRSVALVNVKHSLFANPVPQQCAEIAQNFFHLDYSSYHSLRQYRSYSEMFKPRPRGWTAFEVMSMLFALASAFLGAMFLVLGIIILFGGRSFASSPIAGMYFLYGSLAAYFGVTDLIACSRSLGVTK